MTEHKFRFTEKVRITESGPTPNLYKKLIRNWHEKATTEDYFSKFVFEYLAFIAIIKKFKGRTSGTDRGAIQNLKRDDNIKQEYMKEINRKEDLEKLIKYLKESPLENYGDLKWWGCSDPSPCSEPRPEYQKGGFIKDNNDWENMAEFIYYVRNNLFHGAKDPEDGRDQCLVEHAYKLLNPLVEILLNKIGMGGD